MKRRKKNHETEKCQRNFANTLFISFDQKKKSHRASAHTRNLLLLFKIPSKYAYQTWFHSCFFCGSFNPQMIYENPSHVLHDYLLEKSWRTEKCGRHSTTMTTTKKRHTSCRNSEWQPRNI